MMARKARETLEIALSGATRIDVRPHHHDQYGRIVGRVRVDGVDLGEIMLQAGVAAPWGGRREDWCG